MYFKHCNYYFNETYRIFAFLNKKYLKSIEEVCGFFACWLRPGAFFAYPANRSWKITSLKFAFIDDKFLSSTTTAWQQIWNMNDPIALSHMFGYLKQRRNIPPTILVTHWMDGKTCCVCTLVPETSLDGAADTMYAQKMWPKVYN